jgi:LPXTG-motif cell wall-anchored protein
MPDPHKALAPIIEPVAPPPAPAGPDILAPALAIAGLVLLLALAAWYWRRRKPLRELDAIARLNDSVMATHRLSAWAAGHGIHPTPEWRAHLERLRFGPPSPAAGETLARLCREAIVFTQDGKNGNTPSPAPPRTPPGEGLGEREAAIPKPKLPDR